MKRLKKEIILTTEKNITDEDKTGKKNILKKKLLIHVIFFWVLNNATKSTKGTVGSDQNAWHVGLVRHEVQSKIFVTSGMYDMPFSWHHLYYGLKKLKHF